MGLDGLSMSNLGLHKEATSAQMAAHAEQLASKGLEFKIKDIEQPGSQKGVARKDEDASKQQEQFEDGLENQEDGDDISEEKNQKVARTFDSAEAKDFSVRINPNNEMIELFSNKSKKVVETISAGDLMELISKLDSASGILVNRKI